MIILTDAEKVIQEIFLIKSLNNLGTERDFPNLRDHLQKNPTVNIVFNDETPQS